MISLLIIIATVVVSISAFSKQDLFDKLKFNAFSIVHKKQHYRLLSHIFVHGGYGHLAFNMLTLYFFGSYVEKTFQYHFDGNVAIVYFLLLYFGGAIVSSLYSLEKYKNDAYYNAVGASGAVSAVLYSYILLDPWGKIYIFFIPGVAVR
ncbi:MAG: rhomboid family intramembrane serine protease, partial [Bacteroidales bacterium]